MTDDLRTRRLAAFKKAQDELEKEGKITSLNDWCVKAKVGWSTVNGFLTGGTRLMTDGTYVKLGSVVGWSVPRLKGEPEPKEHTEEEAEYMALFRRLSPSERKREIKALRARLDDADPR